VISNQGFVSAVDRGIVDQPSDDPNTPTANDPTRDIVGNLPLLFADKRVALSSIWERRASSIRVTRCATPLPCRTPPPLPLLASCCATLFPANTTYVANSTLLNGSPVGQPDGGVSPLVAGVNAGVVSAGTTSTLQFDLRVNAGTAAGTLISNQAVVDSVELPDLLTDGDGNPATGPEPTVVVVGVGQQLSITKQVTVVGGGAALPGSVLEYVVRATNIAAVPASSVVITDDIGASAPGQLTYVSGSASMNGSTSGVSVAGSVITANYGAASGPLAPGGSFCCGSALFLIRVLRQARWSRIPAWSHGTIPHRRPARAHRSSSEVFPAPCPRSSPISESRCSLIWDRRAIVDPGDTLRYTITTQNSGTNAATGVVLRDTVPANTTYVANSTLLNGLPLASPMAVFRRSPPASAQALLRPESHQHFSSICVSMRHSRRYFDQQSGCCR
jgi:uncharacterized repeat protein (TIGR01451 family)